MKAKKLECIDGETLMDMRLESIRYCVEGLLPQGVAMIGGVPIIGNLCRAKAKFVSGKSNGKRFLNIRYDSGSDGSDVKDGKISGVKTAVPAVPAVPVVPVPA